MAETSKENLLAQSMHDVLKILGIQEVPEALIKQIASRIGSKPNPNTERKLKASLVSIGLTPSKSYNLPEMIAFNVKDEGGDITLKESFSFNGHMRQFSEDTKDLFTVVECLHLVLYGISCRRNLSSPTEFQFLHETIQEYLDVCAKGELNGKPFSTNDNSVNYFKNVCTAAQRRILGKEIIVDSTNLLKYQKHLAVQEALLPFQLLGSPKDYTEIKTLFEVPLVAEKAIEVIMRSGFDYDESIAIYNQRFGCAYEPFVGVAVVCVSCHRVNHSQNSKPIERCVYCKDYLFRMCRRKECSTAVPRSIDTCPLCGSRESDLKNLANIIASAKSFADKGSVEQAESCFAIVQRIDPDNKIDLNDIQKMIDRAKKERTDIVQGIDALIGKRVYYEAAKKLAEARRKVPPETLYNIETRIVNSQNNADKLFTTVSATTDDLQKVLAICADHPGALERIAKIPPKPPTNLSISENERYVQLSWNASPEMGVKYRVVRKRNSLPETAFDINDGDVIESTDNTFARDSSPVPGKFFYAVFAERNGKFSMESANKALLYLPEVSGLSLRQLSDCVEISYRIPKGASGVRVDRKSDGKIANIYNGTKPIVVDSIVPKQCSYAVTALYDNRESKTKEIPFTASVLPKMISPQIQVEQNNVSIAWETVQKGFDVKVLSLTQTHFVPEIGRIYVDSELSEKTQQLAIASCEEHGLSFNVTPNYKYTLVVIIGSSNGWLCSGLFPVYAGVYPKVRRIPHSVGLKGDHYFIFEESLPDNIYEFSFAISKNNNLPSPRDYKLGSMMGYSGADEPMIRVPKQDHAYVGRYYIFCKFVLKDGTETMPTCSEVHFRQDIQVQVNLKGRGIRLKGDIRFKLNRYDFECYAELPELILVVGNASFNVNRCTVSPTKSDYVCVVDLELPTPINNKTEVKLVPTNPVFTNDFTINYKIQ